MGTDGSAGGKLRDFLLRGGFFMCDDFHGSASGHFVSGMSRVFPDRPIVDIEKRTPFFIPFSISTIVIRCPASS